MQAKQASNDKTTESKSGKAIRRQAESFQRRLEPVRKSVEKQSPATRAILAGRFKVD